MDNRIEIRSSAFQHDMAPWCVEKASTVVRELARIAELVNAQESVSEELREEMLLSLYPALWDATKILAFSCGTDWNPTDRDVLLKGGELAFEELQVKYGLLRETSAQKRDQKRICDIEEFISAFRELLSGDRSPNRTLMHELISRTCIKEPLIDALGEKLDRVTMGIVEWPTFVSKAQTILAELEHKTKDDGSA